MTRYDATAHPVSVAAPLGTPVTAPQAGTRAGARSGHSVVNTGDSVCYSLDSGDISHFLPQLQVNVINWRLCLIRN